MKLLAGGVALAGLTGCERQRGEKILPYVRSPRYVIPGIPQWYTTSLVLDGFATGVLVETQRGHPTKIEGNPDHPASLGATTAFDQAAVIGLYDPDRAQAIRVPEGPPTWDGIAARFGRPRAQHNNP
jgi:molybdopterin-containing oxidoreductase family iron-sulfur binding subunit